MIEIVTSFADKAGVTLRFLVAFLAKLAFGALPGMIRLDSIVLLDIIVGLGDTEVVVALLAGRAIDEALIFTKGAAKITDVFIDEIGVCELDYNWVEVEEGLIFRILVQEIFYKDDTFLRRSLHNRDDLLLCFFFDLSLFFYLVYSFA